MSSGKYLHDSAPVGAAPGSAFEVGQQRAGRVSRPQSIDRFRDAAKNDGQFVVEVVRQRGSRHAAGPVGFGESFHDRMLAPELARAVRPERVIVLFFSGLSSAE